VTHRFLRRAFCFNIISGRVPFHESESSANASYITAVKKHELVDKTTEIRSARFGTSPELKIDSRLNMLN